MIKLSHYIGNTTYKSVKNNSLNLWYNQDRINHKLPPLKYPLIKYTFKFRILARSKCPFWRSRWRAKIYNNKVGIIGKFLRFPGIIASFAYKTSLVRCKVPNWVCFCIAATMFRSKSESNVVYKCTVQLLEDSDVLECEFQV